MERAARWLLLVLALLLLQALLGRPQAGLAGSGNRPPAAPSTR